MQPVEEKSLRVKAKESKHGDQESGPAEVRPMCGQGREGWGSNQKTWK